MSDFDPEEFMNVTVEGELDTKRPVVPSGQYVTQIFKVTPKGGTIGKGDNIGKPWRALGLTLEVMDDAVKEEMHQDRVFVSYQVFLDLDDNDQIDLRKGRNVALGKLRAAVGQNDGSPWSPAMLIGQMVEANVTIGTHPQSHDEMNNVTAVAAYEG